MIKLAPNENCSACGACMSVCHKSAISMKSDETGQISPFIDMGRCIECHACEKVCPVLSSPPSEKPRKAYAAWSLDKEQRHTSASGGVAYELYRYALNHGYKVVGASQNEDFSVSLKMASSEEEIMPFKNSKYVFSECYTLYPQLREALQRSEKVLIVGMSCQIAAMRNLYAKYADQIVFVEILCHGMVPYSYLQQHVSSLEQRLQKKAFSMSFRAPETYTYTFTFTLYDDTGKCFYAARKFDGDTYQIGYSTGVIYFENCYHCCFAKRERVGDIILCDFYGLGNKVPFQHDLHEVSCVITVTDKGQEFMNQVFEANVLYREERPVSEAVAGNPRLRIPSPKTKKRLEFEKNILMSHGDYEQAIAPLSVAFMKTVNRSKMYYHWQGVKYRLRKLLRKLFKK